MKYCAYCDRKNADPKTCWAIHCPHKIVDQPIKKIRIKKDK